MTWTNILLKKNCHDYLANLSNETSKNIYFFLTVGYNFCPKTSLLILPYLIENLACMYYYLHKATTRH